MRGHKVVTVERNGGYAARCEGCAGITFGGFDTRTEAREALTHEEAPAGQGEGEDQNIEGNQSMSKAIRKARAAKAQRGTIAADHRIEIRDTPETARELNNPRADFLDPSESFTGDELATMPLKIVQSKMARVIVWRSHTGEWFRHGGFLRIGAGADGVHRYVLTLPKGANRDDLDSLLAKVNRARAGATGRQWKKLGLDWSANVDDRTFSYAYTSRPYGDPYLLGDAAAPVVVCDEPLCPEQWHHDYDAHELDSVVRQLPEQRGGYDIRVRRFRDETRWTVDVHTDEFYGTADDVTVFVNDLQWMHAECLRANQTPVAEAVPA